MFSSFCPLACMPSQHSTTSSSSICGTGNSTISPSKQESCSSEPTQSSACLRSATCGTRRASRAALMRAISETTATVPAVRVKKKRKTHRNLNCYLQYMCRTYYSLLAVFKRLLFLCTMCLYLLHHPVNETNCNRNILKYFWF